MLENEAVNYEPLSVRHTLQVHDFLLDHYFSNEPISRAAGVRRTHLTPGLMEHVTQCLLSELSFGAYNSTGELIGVAINVVMDRYKREKKKTVKVPKLEEEFSSHMGWLIDPERDHELVKIDTFLKLLNEIPRRVFNRISWKNSVKMFNCRYLVVAPQYGRRGVSVELAINSQKLAKTKAKDLQLKHLTVTTTSHYAFKAFRRCGYEILRELGTSAHFPLIEGIDGGVHRKGRVLLKNI